MVEAVKKTETHEEYLQRLLRETQAHVNKYEQQDNEKIKKQQEAENKRYNELIEKIDPVCEQYDKVKAEYKVVVDQLACKAAMGVRAEVLRNPQLIKCIPDVRGRKRR